MKLNSAKCKEMPIKNNQHQHIYFCYYFHFGDRTSFHFGLFFGCVQMRKELFKKGIRALKITEEKKHDYVTTLISHNPTILISLQLKI